MRFSARCPEQRRGGPRGSSEGICEALLPRCESKERTQKLSRMPSNCRVSAIGLLNLCLVVCMSLQFGASSAFDAYPDEPCTLNLTLRNFRLILSWELENKSIPPTRSTVWHTIMSKPEEPKVVENCTNITTSSCDVTDEWCDISESYISIIRVYRGNSAVSQCWKTFTAREITVEPPEFEIVGFTDHINVTVRFPPVTPKIKGENMWDVLGYIWLVIKEQMGESIKLHKSKLNNTTGNFTYVLKDLLPKANYCVSVYFDTENLGAVIKSPLKCTLLQPVRESGLSESAKVGLITGGLILAVIMSAIIMMKRIGYICLKNNFPNVLNFRNFLSWIFPELPPSEAVSKLEIIPTNKKKKLWNYDYGDESDSDDEEVPKASATGYTRHGLMEKLLNKASDSSANSQAPQPEGDSAAEESDEAGVGAEPELPTDVEAGLGLGPSEQSTGPYEKRENVSKDSFPGGDSSSVDGPGGNVIFNVNLNTVFLRVLHDGADEASEVLSLAEDTVDLDEGPHRTESCFPVAPGERTQWPHSGLSSQSLWTEEGSSEKTDTSDSDADIGDGYIIR